MIHTSARTGYDREAATYAKARPGYHPDLVGWVVAAAGRGPIVELGAGTGISTAALSVAGLEVSAVEPVRAMRAEIAAAAPDAPVLGGTAEAIPVADASAAAVIVAQAFHWFDHRLALGEITRVLRPGGALITMWNVRDEDADWVAAYTDIVNAHAGDTPRYASMDWRRAIEGDDRFEFADEFAVPNPQPTDADGVVARALSTSFIAALELDAQADIERRLRAVVAPLGDAFAYPYRSEAQRWIRRR